MTTPSPTRLENVKTVAIVGGGASGLLALKVLLEEGAFDKVELFERRGDIGGVWCVCRDNLIEKLQVMFYASLSSPGCMNPTLREKSWPSSITTRRLHTPSLPPTAVPIFQAHRTAA